MTQPPESIVLGCAFCDQESRPHAMTPEDVSLMVAGYMAHVVLAHWPHLEAEHLRQVMNGGTTTAGDLWTRI